jgi:hypothetical protein
VVMDGARRDDEARRGQLGKGREGKRNQGICCRDCKVQARMVRVGNRNGIRRSGSIRDPPLSVPPTRCKHMNVCCALNTLMVCIVRPLLTLRLLDCVSCYDHVFSLAAYG